MPGGDFVVRGSNEEDCYQKKLWQKVADEARASSKGCISNISRNLSDYNLPGLFSSPVGEEVAVEARCLGIEHIAGPIVRDRDNVLKALYSCGEDDIMGTNVMRAVLDFKWGQYTGKDYRFTFTMYWLYVVFFMLA